MIYFLFIITLTLSLVSVSVALYNLITKPVLLYLPRSGISTKPLVSVLIPARNEAEVIKRILYSITQQTYRNIEIIVLDDHSEDRTFAVATSVANTEPRMRILRGKDLPDGWTGKNWACFQLAKEAQGDMMLFIDADVELAPEAISSAVVHMELNRVDMLSVFPTQIMNSFGERLVVPLMNWILISFLPLRLVYESPNPKFAAANGQFILIRCDAYFHIGGHEAIREKIVEDMEIARALKRSGMRIITLLGGDLVACRMYAGAEEAVGGFTKNFYPGFNTSGAVFIPLLIVLCSVFLAPFIAIIEYGIFIYPVIAVLLNRILVSIASNQSPLYNIILHPFHMIIMVIIGIRSVEAYTKGKIVWKGRRL
jgi:glycosyltransferase involved in cell wall biosynthesis